MQFGVVYPQTDHPTDGPAVRDFAQAVEGLGFSHVTAYEHVLGANPDRPGGWKGPYTYQATFLEPFVLYTFMAAHTTRLGFFTGILILPQRQTALVAKQAATLDVLSGGRFRLGVGNGWNEVEYVGLGEDFHTRGRKIEEQVEVLRLLWTRPLLTHHGRWHHIEEAGLNPLPLQQPIPIWFGGHHERVLRRAARLGDGWAPSYRTAADARPSLDKLEAALAAAGRERRQFGLEVRLPFGDGKPDVWAARVAEWQAVGATHLGFNTLGAGFTKPEEHIAAVRRFAETVGIG
ncbi:MAG: LLM class F420-dependent oxidoreductase [Gammaproteobacteria bacterium RBG_16_66_13]|nr:MAG: LLM class F420-dependent oxidoreductase [Gammaproteobacteria bacterium RBG_16_66_13]